MKYDNDMTTEMLNKLSETLNEENKKHFELTINRDEGSEEVHTHIEGNGSIAVLLGYAYLGKSLAESLDADIEDILQIVGFLSKTSSRVYKGENNGN